MKTFRTIITLSLTFIAAIATAQDLDAVWREISANNLTLKGCTQQMEAQRMENRVGLAPENPEVEFAYLWNSNNAGNRIDFSVTQAFDFPTSYVYRSRIANLRDNQAEELLRQQQNEVLQQAGQLYYDIIYANGRIKDMERCLKYLSDVSDAYQRKLEAGECNIFEYNRVRLAELSLRQEKSHAEVQRESLLRELQQLNGGIAIAVEEDDFPTLSLGNSFEEWQWQNPKLNWLNRQQEIAQQQLKLRQSEWAPQFFAGYMREQVPSETFQGIKVGLSLPLWHNANTLKQSKLQATAANMMAADEQFRFRAHLESCYENTKVLLQQIEEFRALLEDVDALELLNRALESGQISLLEYLEESSLYHDSHERLEEMQHDAALQYLELQLYSRQQ